MYYSWYHLQVATYRERQESRTWALLTAHIARGTPNLKQLAGRLDVENATTEHHVRRELVAALPPSVQAMIVLPHNPDPADFWRTLLAQFPPESAQYKFYLAGYRAQQARAAQGA